jgi:hypothetical protein
MGMSSTHLSFGAVATWSSQWKNYKDGRIILSKETWTLSEDRAAIERSRERTGDQAGKQTIIYLRQAPKA